MTRPDLRVELYAIIKAEPREGLTDIIADLEAAKCAAQEKLFAASAPPTAEQKLWDAKDVAEYLGIPPSKVETLARQRAIPSGRFGKYVRFLPADVRAWAERQLSPTKRRS